MRNSSLGTIFIINLSSTLATKSPRSLDFVPPDPDLPDVPVVPQEDELVDEVLQGLVPEQLGGGRVANAVKSEIVVFFLMFKKGMALRKSI